MTAVSPMLLFWLGLPLKIAMTASIVVAASIVVERRLVDRDRLERAAVGLKELAAASG